MPFFEGKEYIKIDLPSGGSTFNDAENAAINFKGHSVSINSQEELQFIVDNFGIYNKHIWTGANDIQIEGDWQWTDGSSTGLLSDLKSGDLWPTHEPNGGEDNRADEDVAVISHSTTKLHDVMNASRPNMIGVAEIDLSNSS
jgi:hypothetical protein